MEPGRDDQEDLKKKLVRRIAIAGVLVVVLLGGLTLVEDYLLEKPAPAPTAAAKPEVTTEPDKAEEKPAEEKKEEPKAEEKVAEEVKAEPEKTETPLAPAPEAKPASRVVIKTGPPAPPAPPVPAKKPEPAPATPAASATPPPDPATVIARSYRLQMGVFTTASNADELHTRLEKAGIPSYVESRVHVGPFKTQKEADAARRKLKELGLGPGLLIPPQKRN